MIIVSSMCTSNTIIGFEIKLQFSRLYLKNTTRLQKAFKRPGGGIPYRIHVMVIFT